MANLADDDLLLVQRTSAGISTNYSITGSALKEDLTGVTGLIANPVEVLTPLDGSGLSGDINYYPETSTITAVENVSGGGAVAAAASNSWYDITYGDGKYVAISYDGTYRVMYSTDAINWSTATAAHYFWLSVTYADNKFVAVGSSGDHRVMYSSNGINWTTVEAAQSNSWRSIAYGNGKFVAVSSNGNNRIQYSTTGTQNWGNASAPENNDWYGVAYGDNNFVAVARNGTYRVMNSPDGINWSAQTAAVQEGWRDVAYGNGKFVAVSDTGSYRVMWSSNGGTTWNAVVSEASSSWQSVTYGNGKFVAVATSGDNRIMWADEDNIGTWHTVAAPEQNSWQSVTYGNGKFVALASDGTNRVMYSPDGVDWSSGDSTTLTLTNDKVFDSSNSTEMSTVDQVLTAGTVVEGETSTPAADTPVLSTTYFTGNGIARTVTTGIDNTSESLVWVKDRDANGSIHNLYDTVRGLKKRLSTSGPGVSHGHSAGVTSFLSDGFTLGGGDSDINRDGYRNVAWNFRAAPGFFDIVAYDGDGVAGRALDHQLGSVPGCVIIKNLTSSADWFVWHKENKNPGDVYSQSYMKLNTTDDTQRGNWIFYSGQGTMSSTQFGGLGPYLDSNQLGEKYVAYLFADTPGLIKCGTVTSGAGNTPTAVNCGFTPSWILIKGTDANTAGGGPTDWDIHWKQDNGAFPTSSANRSDAEQSSYRIANISSSGFDYYAPRSYTNFIYIAIAENPAAGNFTPTGVLSADADASTPSINLTDVTGNWTSGMTAVGQTQLTEYAPGPDDITFTSRNAGTTPFTGSDATLAFRRWTLESRSSAGDPWIVVDTYEDYDVLNSQDGATPWSSNKPTLAPNTMYRVKVAYISTNADPVESVYNTFTTGSN